MIFFRITSLLVIMVRSFCVLVGFFFSILRIVLLWKQLLSKYLLTLACMVYNVLSHKR